MRAAVQIERFMKYCDELELDYQSRREEIEAKFKEDLNSIDSFIEDLQSKIKRFNRIISTVQEMKKCINKDDRLVSQEMVINDIKGLVDYAKKAINERKI